MQYNPASRVAEEFINDEEIQATLRYADEHKSDRELIEKLIEQAAAFKACPIARLPFC